MIDSVGAPSLHFAFRISHFAFLSNKQAGPDPGLCPGGILSLSFCVLICSSSRKEKRMSREEEGGDPCGSGADSPALGRYAKAGSG
jgi:hypothetical protein